MSFAALKESHTLARGASTRGGDSQQPALLHRLPQSRSRTYLSYKVVQWSWWTPHHEPSFSSRFVSAMTIAMKALPCEAIKCHPPGKEPTEAAYTTAKSTRGGDEPPTTTTDLRSPQHNEDQQLRPTTRTSTTSRRSHCNAQETGIRVNKGTPTPVHSSFPPPAQ